MNLKTVIYLVRHGETEWNVQKKMQGHQDSALTELGVKQAEWLGKSLQHEPIDIVYSSSSLRAKRTAEVIKGVRKIDIIESDDFKEINLGVWEGKTQSEVEKENPAQFYYFWNNPVEFRLENSETFIEVYDRSVNRLNQIISEHHGKTILIVTHTVVVKLLMAHFEGRQMNNIWEPPYIHPTCLCKIEIIDKLPEIILHGDISHYKEEPNNN